MATASPLLTATGLGRRRSRSDAWLLRGVNLAIRGGDRLAITGPTGAGKTLLLRALSLLDLIDEGEVRWREKPIAPADIPFYRRQVIYLHQRPTFVEGTVEDNLRLPYSLRASRGDHFDRHKALKLLGSVGRGGDLLSRTDQDLSGGERQLVAIARALQLEPTVLLLDEPTASLDREAAQSIEDLVLGWQRQNARERAVVFVSHSPEQVGRVADRILSMQDGCITGREVR